MTQALNSTVRYIATEHNGIRKDTVHGNYQAYKYVVGKKVSKTFKKISDAIRWRNGTFVEKPLAVFASPVSVLCAEKDFNGRQTELTFGELWKIYREVNLQKFEKATIETNDFLSTIWNGVFDVKMHELNPDLLDEYIREQKQMAIMKNSQRYNFDHPLKLLRTICNWYKGNKDFKFSNPVLQRHFLLGVIKPTPEREKKLSSEEYLLYRNALEPFYRDFSVTQFYGADRVSEIAGLQFTCVNFAKRTMTIKYVVVWNKKKCFVDLKTYTKTHEIRHVHMNDDLYEILQRRLKEKHPSSDYVFHEEGRPLSYRKIQYQYNKALRLCGLSHRYSGTHIMRHSMASITRDVTGTLEHTQAVTGHKDQRMVQHYASMPEKRNKEAVEQVQMHLRKLSGANLNESENLVSGGEQNE